MTAAPDRSNVVALDAHREDDLALVAPGDYLARYVRHVGVAIFRTRKLRVDFRLLDYPQPVILPRWYRVIDCRGGRIRARPTSSLVREVQSVLGVRVRHDRIPVASLADHEVMVRVRTVTTDHEQRELTSINQYSVVERILERVT